MMPEGPPTPIDIYTKAPDQRVSVMHTPERRECNRLQRAGWLAVVPRTSAARDVGLGPARREAGCRIVLSQLAPATVHRAEVERESRRKWRDRKRIWCWDIVKGQPPVKFYFDKSSGLLLRMVHYTDTPLGLNPTQVDFADYRSVDGVKTPYPVDDCAAQRSIHHSDR